MITIFTTPKPFKGRIREIQINALKSWKLLHPDIEVIIFGDEEGTLDVANNLGLVHIPDVETNECGLPLVNSMFDLAQRRGRYEIQCYVNADIILLSDFVQALARVPFKEFLMVGQRWDLELCKPIDFDINDWQKELMKRVHREAILHPPAGSDYFAYRRGALKDILPMSVGRPRWDNWMIYHARARGIPVIDCTSLVTVIHQNHPAAYDDISRGGAGDAPTQRNFELVSIEHRFTLRDANWLLTPGGLKRNRSRGYLIRTIETFPVLHPKFEWFSEATKVLVRWLRRGWYSQARTDG